MVDAALHGWTPGIDVTVDAGMVVLTVTYASDDMEVVSIPPHMVPLVCRWLSEAAVEAAADHPGQTTLTP